MTRDELIAAMRGTAAPKPTPVDVPGWGRVYVKTLTVEEADEASEFKPPDGTRKQALARGAARVICDENGARLFDQTNEEDVALLAKQPWSLLQKLMATGGEANGDATKN